MWFLSFFLPHCSDRCTVWPGTFFVVTVNLCLILLTAEAPRPPGSHTASFQLTLLHIVGDDAAGWLLWAVIGYHVVDTVAVEHLGLYSVHAVSQGSVLCCYDITHWCVAGGFEVGGQGLSTVFTWQHRSITHYRHSWYNVTVVMSVPSEQDSELFTLLFTTNKKSNFD